MQKGSNKELIYENIKVIKIKTNKMIMMKI